MGSTGYVSLSLASALERSLDATAHNLSNASTAGYKAFRPVFEAVESETVSASGDAISYVRDGGSYVDPAPGAIMPTGNPLDLAISGGAWFQFETDGDQVAYGRNGRLVVDIEGRLTTTSGHALLDAGGGPIVLPDDVGQEISIASDGTITGPDGALLGQVGLYDVESDALMHPIGNGLYISPLAQAAVPAEGSTVTQGFVEASNVQPIIEMTRMIDIQRAYENSLRLVGEEDSLTKQAIQRLGRAG